MKFSTSHKLSNKSAFYFSLTSMIGSGIFIKTQSLNQLSHNQITPLIFLFLIFLINMFAFCHILLKIIPHQTGNMGFIEWSKEFCSPWLNAIFCNFTRHFYHPISLFLFSVYSVVGISGGRYIGVGFSLLIAFMLVFALLLLNFISFKWSSKIQMCLWAIILIPISLLPLIGIIKPGVHSYTEHKYTDGSPWFILVSGLPSVLFIYDGFYNITSLKDKLCNPKNLRYIVVGSIITVTLIYLYVIIGFNIGDPDTGNYKNFLFLKDKPVLKDLFEILISMASVLTLNSIATSSIPQLTSMYYSQKFRDVKAFKNFLFYRKISNGNDDFEVKFSIWFYLILKTLLCFIVIGGLMIVINKYTQINAMEIMNSLADIISVLVFVILVSTILGSLKKYGTEENFKYWAMISSAITFVALFYLMGNYISGIYSSKIEDRITGWIKTILMASFLIGSSSSWQIFIFIEKKLNRRKNLLHSYYHKDSLTVLK